MVILLRIVQMSKNNLTHLSSHKVNESMLELTHVIQCFGFGIYRFHENLVHSKNYFSCHASIFPIAHNQVTSCQCCHCMLEKGKDIFGLNASKVKNKSKVGKRRAKHSLPFPRFLSSDRRHLWLCWMDYILFQRGTFLHLSITFLLMIVVQSSSSKR